MERYRNRNTASGVTHYYSGEDFIIVCFAADQCYLYDFAHTGRTHVKAMQKFAAAGRGLSTYISQKVKDRFASKCDFGTLQHALG